MSMKVNFKSIKPHTWVSVLMVLVVIVNQVLSVIGKPVINIGEEQITYVVNMVMNIVFIVYAAWKNNSVTDNAQITDEVLFMLRDGKISKEELEGFIEAHRNPEVPTD